MADFSPLGKKLNFNPATIFNIFAGLASIFGFINFLEIIPPEPSGRIYAYFVIALVLLLLMYIYYTHRTKQHRYAQTTIYTHFVSHIMRDYLANLQKALAHGIVEDSTIGSQYENTIQKSLDSIAECFSILTGKKCSATIKELHENKTVTTFMRDKISSNSRKSLDGKETTHTLAGNTDFYNLFFGLKDCPNAFFCNNLIGLWKKDGYKNSSFKLVDDDVKSFIILNWKFVTHWPLKYKSTMVFPIRYIEKFTPPTPEQDLSNLQHWKFHGFLCIDCNSKNIFDYRHMLDLGATFADSFYIFLSQTAYMLDVCTKPEENK